MDRTTILELCLLGMAGVTMTFSIYSLWMSHVDHTVLTRLKENGVKRLTLAARLVRDIARVACSSVMLGASVWCIWLPPDHHVAAVVLKSAMILVAFFLGVAVVGDFRWRRQIDAALERLDE